MLSTKLTPANINSNTKQINVNSNNSNSSNNNMINNLTSVPYRDNFASVHPYLGALEQLVEKQAARRGEVISGLRRHMGRYGLRLGGLASYGAVRYGTVIRHAPHQITT